MKYSTTSQWYNLITFNNNQNNTNHLYLLLLFTNSLHYIEVYIIQFLNIYFRDIYLEINYGKKY